MKQWLINLLIGTDMVLVKQSDMEKDFHAAAALLQDNILLNGSNEAALDEIERLTLENKELRQEIQAIREEYEGSGVEIDVSTSFNKQSLHIAGMTEAARVAYYFRLISNIFKDSDLDKILEYAQVRKEKLERKAKKEQIG